MRLTPTRFAAGSWEGVLDAEGAGGDAPSLVATLRGAELPAPELVEESPGTWAVRLRVPPEAIGEGVQTFVISDARSGERLASFSLVAGEALGHDLRAEIDLLRAELDLLKRAFRRHCFETGG